MRTDWSNNEPINQDKRKYIMQRICEFKEDFQDRFSIQNVIGTSQTLDGLSNNIILRTLASPTVPASEAYLYVDNSDYNLYHKTNSVTTKLFSRNSPYEPSGVLSGTDATERTTTATSWTFQTNLTVTITSPSVGQVYFALGIFQMKDTYVGYARIYDNSANAVSFPAKVGFVSGAGSYVDCTAGSYILITTAANVDVQYQFYSGSGYTCYLAAGRKLLIWRIL